MILGKAEGQERPRSEPGSVPGYQGAMEGHKQVGIRSGTHWKGETGGREASRRLRRESRR